MPIKKANTEKNEVKHCPYCDNEIKAKAIKCQYCWEFLDTRINSQKMGNFDEKSGMETFNDDVKMDENSELEWSDQTSKRAYIFWSIWVWIDKKGYPRKKEKIIKKDKTKEAREAVEAGCGCYCIWSISFLLLFFRSIVVWDWSWVIPLINFLLSMILLCFFYRNNRVAAIFSFITYIIGSIYMVSLFGSLELGEIWSWIIFIFWILTVFGIKLGMEWTFSYRKLINKTKITKSEIVLLVICVLIMLFEIRFYFF